MTRMKKVEKFIEVYQPLHTFKMLSRTLHECLTEESYNKCLDFEQEMWPELMQKLDEFEDKAKRGIEPKSQGTAFDLSNLDEDKFDIDNFGRMPKIPEPVEIIKPVVTDFTEGQ